MQEFQKILEQCTVKKRLMENVNHWKTVRFDVQANPGTNIDLEQLSGADIHTVYETLAAPRIRNCPEEIYFKTLITAPYILTTTGTHGCAYDISYRNIGKCGDPITAFHNDFYRNSDDMRPNDPNIIGINVIDGYPGDWADIEKKPGIAICKISLTKQGKFLIDALDTDYMDHPKVRKLIKESKSSLLELFGSQ